MSDLNDTLRDKLREWRSRALDAEFRAKDKEQRLRGQERLNEGLLKANLHLAHQVLDLTVIMEAGFQ